MKELSIFIDESGDFGPYEHHAPYYLIALVFHDQSKSIVEPLAALKRHVSDAGFPETHAVHSAPLIRREADYSNLDIVERRKLFRALFTFMRQCEISFRTFVFHKRGFLGHDAMVSRISRDIGQFVRDNLEFFQSFNRIVVYYDNGQKEITNVINTVFNVFLDAEVRKVKPSEYGLFQAADLLCSLCLISEKLSNDGLTKSEIEFFHSQRDLRRNYLKPAWRKRME